MTTQKKDHEAHYQKYPHNNHNHVSINFTNSFKIIPINLFVG